MKPMTPTSAVYRFAVHLLPSDLRRSQGAAMEDLFASEIARARTQGWMSGVSAFAAGMWDVIKRAIYERARPSRGPGGPLISPSNLLRRLAASFFVAFVALTSALLFTYGSRQIPALLDRDASAGVIAQAMLYAVPFTAAMTIPMAVFLAVLHVFTRVGASGAFVAPSREVRRLVMAVLVATLGVTAVSLVVTAEIVPRANERLATVLTGTPTVQNDRTMTISELRKAARKVQPSTEPVALARAASYEVEVQKKFALPAACLVLAMVGMVIAFAFPRGGVWLMFGAGLVVFGAYYVMIMAGEGLADRRVVSPIVGMWGANAVLLAAALLAVWRPRRLREVATLE